MYKGFACMLPVFVKCFNELTSCVCPAIEKSFSGSAFVCFIYLIAVGLYSSPITANQSPMVESLRRTPSSLYFCITL